MLLDHYRLFLSGIVFTNCSWFQFQRYVITSMYVESHMNYINYYETTAEQLSFPFIKLQIIISYQPYCNYSNYLKLGRIYLQFIVIAHTISKFYFSIFIMSEKLFKMVGNSAPWLSIQHLANRQILNNYRIMGNHTQHPHF